MKNVVMIVLSWSRLQIVRVMPLDRAIDIAACAPRGIVVSILTPDGNRN